MRDPATNNCVLIVERPCPTGSAPDPATRDAILANPLYRNITAKFVQSHDYIAMERLHEIHASGRYDLIVVDPPSYQKGSFVATKDYARLLRRLFDLMLPGGHALLCLNAPELGTDFLKDQVRELAPELEFVERVDNPPVFADVSDERSLKVLVYRAPPLQ